MSQTKAGKTSKAERRRANAAAAAQAARATDRRRAFVWWAGIALAVLAVIGGLFLIYLSASDEPSVGPSAKQQDVDYDIASPGPGEAAPDFTLPSTKGGTVSLETYRGKTVLLYFHEGLGCQPCWDQIRDLEKAQAKIKAVGVDELVTITTGPVDLIGQKMRDDQLTSVALADTDLAVSKQYEANKYGMMGDSRDGHSFLLIGPDGTIQWRADYGGAPDYTMYVPVDKLLADLEAGREPA